MSTKNTMKVDEWMSPLLSSFIDPENPTNEPDRTILRKLNQIIELLERLVTQTTPRTRSGRASADSSEVRDRLFTMRISETDRRRLEQMSERYGRSAADILRSYINAKHDDIS